jgi:hypothetical protein
MPGWLDVHTGVPVVMVTLHESSVLHESIVTGTIVSGSTRESCAVWFGSFDWATAGPATETETPLRKCGHGTCTCDLAGRVRMPGEGGAEHTSSKKSALLQAGSVLSFKQARS